MKLDANCLAELQRTNYAKDHLLARNRIDYSFRALIDRTIHQQRRGERRLAEQRATKDQFHARNSCISDGRNYRMLNGYFCLPGHNFDWKHAGVSRVIPSTRDPRAMEAKEFSMNLLRWHRSPPNEICSADACHYSQTIRGG